MKQLLYLLLFLLMSTIELLAQPTGFNNSYRSDTFKTSPYNAYCYFTGLEVSDTAYYLIGRGIDSSLYYNNNNPWYETGLFMQIDTNGQIQNHHLFSYDSSSVYFVFNVIDKDKEGNLVCVGRDHYDLILYKITDRGDTLWTQRYIGEDSLHALEPQRIVAAKDGGYLLVLNTFDYTTGSQDLIRGTIIKTDSIGTELWRSEYAASGYVKNFNSNIVETYNYYIIFGQNVYANVHSSSFRWQTQIRKIDSLGNIVGAYLSPINQYIGAVDGVTTQDGGYAFCGRKGTQIMIGGTPSIINQGYIAKVDNNFQLVWEKSLDTPDPGIAHLQEIEELSDGSLIVVGRRNILFPEGANYEVADSGHGMACILKLSAAGDSIWQRLYRKPFTNKNFLNDIEVLSDGGFLAAGYTEQYSTVTFNYDYWGLLIRMDSLGCVVPGCEFLDNTTNKAIDFDNEVTVFPNPASAVVNFQFEQPIAAAVEIRVYSALGQLVGQKSSINPIDKLQMNISDWQFGVYYYGIYQNGQLVTQGQILKQ